MQTNKETVSQSPYLFYALDCTQFFYKLLKSVYIFHAYHDVTAEQTVGTVYVDAAYHYFLLF